MESINPHEIPIYIISYNRPSDLKKCIEKLEQDGYRNIIVIDNKSTDENLLNYYRSLSYKVEYLEENYGHMGFWACGKFDDVIENMFYVVTDPDILADTFCPSEYIEYFLRILQDYPTKTKVGFSLRTDDIPDAYPYKWDIIRYESFFKDQIPNDPRILYDAPIDTTFALYAPQRRDFYHKPEFFDSIRTGYPYIARHLTWYITPDNISKEHEQYFIQGCKSSTAFYDKAINAGRRDVIGWLAGKQDEDLYEILKKICTKSFIKNHVSMKGFVKSVWFILSRKLLSLIGVR